MSRTDLSRKGLGVGRFRVAMASWAKAPTHATCGSARPGMRIWNGQVTARLGRGRIGAIAWMASGSGPF